MSLFSVSVSSYGSRKLIEVGQDWQSYSQVYTATFYGHSQSVAFFLQFLPKYI